MWVRLDDALDEHEKVEALLEDAGEVDAAGLGEDEVQELVGLAAIGLWTLALTNSARRLTDGRVAARVLRRWAPSTHRLLVDRLREVGMLDAGGAREVVVHDFLEYNPSRAEVIERRRRDAERKAAARAAAAARRAAERESARTSTRPSGVDSERTSTRTGGDVRSDVRAESGVESALPDPTRPDPTLSPPTPPLRGGNARSRRKRDRDRLQAQWEAWAADLIRAQGVEPTRQRIGEAVTAASLEQHAHGEVEADRVLRRLRRREPAWPMDREATESGGGGGRG